MTRSPMVFSSCSVSGTAGRRLALVASLALAGLTGCASIPVGPIDESPSRVERSEASAAPIPTNLQATVLATETATVVKTAESAESTLDNTGTITVGSDGAETEWRAYIAFDLSALPRDAEIERAELLLDKSHNSGGRARSAPARIEVVKEAWSARALRWNAQPAVSKKGTLSHDLELARSVEKIDVTKLVQGWVEGSVASNGLRLSSSESAPFWKSFVGTTASEAAAGPRLIIFYRASLVPLGPGADAVASP